METVPGAGGDTRPQSPAGTPDAGGALDAAQRAELRAQGPDGAALARVVDATAPDAAAVPAPAAARGATGTNESPVTAVLAAATGRDEGSALGPLLPAILLVSLLGVLALVLARRRGSA